MSEFYERLQILVYPHGYRVTQTSRISQFNIRGHGRGSRGCGRGNGGIGYGFVHGHGYGGQGGRGVRRYGHNPNEFSSSYIKFVEEARVYSADQCRLLSSQHKNNIQEMKNCEVWRDFDLLP